MDGLAVASSKPQAITKIKNYKKEEMPLAGRAASVSKREQRFD